MDVDARVRELLEDLPPGPLRITTIHVERRLSHVPRAQRASRWADWVVAELAALQDALVATWQLLILEVSRRQIQEALRDGRLHHVHRGVLSLVDPSVLSDRARRRAALLAVGDLSALSHRTAAHHRELPAPEVELLDVSVPTNDGRRIGTVKVHRTASLTEQDVEIVDGLRCTTIARTCVDLAAVVGRPQLRRFCDQADYKGLLDIDAVVRAAGRIQRPRGVVELRDVLLEFEGAKPVPRTRLERLWDRSVPDPGVPQVWIPGTKRRADRWYEDERIAVELDGRGAHERLAAMVDDRNRDRELAALGVLTFRVTWADLIDDALDRTLAQLDAARSTRRKAQ